MFEGSKGVEVAKKVKEAAYELFNAYKPSNVMVSSSSTPTLSSNIRECQARMKKRMQEKFVRHKLQSVSLCPSPNPPMPTFGHQFRSRVTPPLAMSSPPRRKNPPATESSDSNGFNLYTIRPSNRGTEAKGVNIGTFVGSFGENNVGTFASLKNNSLISSYSMPNLSQIEALFREYSPVLYLHPLETYHPSSVNWFFSNGALLYTKGQETNHVRIEPGGSNLPQGGSNDGLYWINLPVDSNEKERVKKGDLQSCEVYLNIKPMFGGTFTDIAIWIFYPFNGPSTAKLGQIEIIPLGIIGEHVGDWEHLTLRISNFNGVLNKLYFSEHSGGSWVNSPNLEFFNGTNKPVAYSSLNGHANYPKPGLVLQGIGDFIGIRNDTAKSAAVLDTGLRFSVAAEAAWVKYCREWGPKITYISEEDIKRVESLLPVEWRGVFEVLINLLPNEFFGEEGPTGPNMKASWTGDEK
nr:uncharacterized protein LOC109177326 [Ipomoea batatas]